MHIKLFIIFLLFAASVQANAGNILVVGDSLSCGPFGKYLTQNLARAGDHVTLYCAVSSAPSHWMRGVNPSGQKCKTMTSDRPTLSLCGSDGKVPTFASLLSARSYSRVVIALGTNSLLSPRTDQSYSAMASATRGAQCDWIGPPHLNPNQSKGFPAGRVSDLENNLNSFYDSLTVSVSRQCSLIDSRGATISGTPGHDTVDGIHRTDSAGRYWANTVMPQLSARRQSVRNQPPAAAR